MRVSDFFLTKDVRYISARSHTHWSKQVENDITGMVFRLKLRIWLVFLLFNYEIKNQVNIEFYKKKLVWFYLRINKLMSFSTSSNMDNLNLCNCNFMSCRTWCYVFKCVFIVYAFRVNLDNVFYGMNNLVSYNPTFLLNYAATIAHAHF